MGSCISKCRASAPLPSIPQDKLVISQSPPTPSNPIPHLFPPPPPSSSSINTSISSSSSAAAASSSSSSSSPSSSSQSLRIAVLDPNKFSHAKPQHVTFPVQTKSKPAASTVVANPKQCKRPRGCSPPPIARQKSFRRSVAPQPLIASKERLRPLNPIRQSTCVAVQNGRREAICKQSFSKMSLMEDFDNPLIAMDCFIFL